MNKAKETISGFMSKAGHHDTTVHETVAPSVQNETVNEHRREEKHVARDNEVHQDHYHTSVQPVQHSEVLPEQHHHKATPVVHREHDHRDHSQTKQHLENEKAKFQNTSTRAPETHHTQGTGSAVSGEHIHHHVHENIQPVVHKQTIEPHVVHTTVPIHEVHHNAAQHHTASTLEPINMADFQKQGGSLTGREVKHDHFAGEPKDINKSVGSAMHNVGNGQHGSHAHDNSLNQSGTGAGVGSNTHSDTHSGTQVGKPSLLDKLNPMKDADGDGKKGFMK
ncbi:hypothetical protein BT63DRAFT_483246 [Microthyrium microscopicum]|uniref:Allergen n=1 Tax=Microthyrium microscopicum TaxID=703497 RepID=A0A6A6TZW3_9PEZI|nr:hypothetical protein BT63DRAFT_483246 [Microthyrium microscopicum]